MNGNNERTTMASDGQPTLPETIRSSDILPDPRPEFSDPLDVIRVAKGLALKAWSDSGQVGALTIDPYRLAIHYGCTVYPVPFNDESMVKQGSDGWANSALVKAAGTNSVDLALETRDVDERQRYSLAHEVGHLLWYKERLDNDGYTAVAIEVGRHADARPDDDKQYLAESPDEYFADMFALMFMLPDWLIGPLVDSDGRFDIATEAKRLKVSQPSLQRRLKYYRMERDAGKLAA